MVSDDLRALLEAERTRTHERIEALRRDYAAILDGMALTSTDDEHDPEGTTIAAERSLVSSLARSSERHLAEVDAVTDVPGLVRHLGRMIRRGIGGLVEIEQLEAQRAGFEAYLASFEGAH